MACSMQAQLHPMPSVIEFEIVVVSPSSSLSPQRRLLSLSSSLPNIPPPVCV